MSIAKQSYKVHCGMRPSSGRFPAQTATSTMFRTVTVLARDEHEARAKAIDECYRQFIDIEHVNPRHVELVQS